MLKLTTQNITKTARLLNHDQIGILPTDTIYGLHTLAFNPKSVERVYQLKGRDQDKPFIVLISSTNDLKHFKINLSKVEKKFLKMIWPGPVSVILPVEYSLFSYLHRGTNSLAFRMPNKKYLLKILKKTGPLISTSANRSNLHPAENIDKAEEDFQGEVDFYVDGGKPSDKPSTVIKIVNGKVEILRQGEVKIELSEINGNKETLFLK